MSTAHSLMDGVCNICIALIMQLHLIHCDNASDGDNDDDYSDDTY